MKRGHRAQPHREPPSERHDAANGRACLADIRCDRAAAEKAPAARARGGADRARRARARRRRRHLLCRSPSARCTRSCAGPPQRCAAARGTRRPTPERQALARLSDERAGSLPGGVLQGQASDGTPSRACASADRLNVVCARNSTRRWRADRASFRKRSCRACPDHAIAGTAPLPRALPPHRQPAPRAEDHAGNALRALHYAVTGSRVVALPTCRRRSPTWATRAGPVGCTPLFSAAKRILVYARLMSILPSAPGAPRAAAPRADQRRRAAHAAAPARPPLPPVLEPRTATSSALLAACAGGPATTSRSR